MRTVVRSTTDELLGAFDLLQLPAFVIDGTAHKVFHENAIAMGRLTIDEAVAQKADRLVLSCPACYAKVNEAMQGCEKQIRITDIMELLASVLAEEPG